MKLTAASLLVFGLLAGAGCGQKPKPEAKPKFTVGKETTYITEPLDEQGYVDYAAALNKRLSQGVTPQTNANVLLWKALGPHPDGGTMPAEFFKWLGIPAPPEQGDYFIGLTAYARERLKLAPGEQVRELQIELELAKENPWTTKDHPDIAGWLKVNEKPLALVVKATKRPRWFSPLVPKKTKAGTAALIGVLLPSVQPCREITGALAARAILRAGQGRFDDGWQDLLACHRLARLAGQGGTVIEWLGGVAIENNTVNADLAFLTTPGLTAKQFRRCLDDLQKLPLLPALADRVDLGERCVIIDSLLKASPEDAKETENIDWDPGLLKFNRFYDRLVTILRVKDRQQRTKQLDKVAAEIKELDRSAKPGGALAKALRSKDPKVKGGAQGDVMICLQFPSIHKVYQGAERAEQNMANLRVAFALACYRAEHGRYPAKLDALAPKYLAAVPGDLFSGKSLIYRPSAKGYLLYSVGVNAQDDGGRGQDDDPPGDDLTVRMPLPELPAK
jgi:hypothetical protein